MNIKNIKEKQKNIKKQEEIETSRKFNCKKPIYARLDGRAFKSFTKSFERPFDINFRQLMVDVTKSLVEETGASLGYTQSDEISLLWYADEEINNKIFFNGRIQKMVSNLSSIATSYFVMQAIKFWPELCLKRPPTFDCRVIEANDIDNAIDMFRLREIDGIKNSIFTFARFYFTDKELKGKKQKDQLKMLNEIGQSWNLLSNLFKYGKYVIKEKRFEKISDDILSKIPEKHKPKNNVVERSIIVERDFYFNSDNHIKNSLTSLYK